MAPLLDISGLTVEFQTATGPLRAVDRADFTVEAGEILAIVGESGSGKSVSMLAVMGLLPSSATISAERMAFADIDLLKVSPARRRQIIGKEIAMIFQEPETSLNPCFTVGFQLGEALSAHLGLGRAARRERMVELLAAVGMPDPEARLSAYPHQLSGGMCQRVMIAIAIACNPRLLIADEPTTALDVTIQAQILELLVRLQREREMALVLITHDMGVVAETAERVVVQYAGQQVERQPVADLFRTPHHPYSAALLAALPDRSGRGRLPSIPGVVPDLAAPPAGCLFHPRCGFADATCRSTAPERGPEELGEALCHYPIAARVERQ